MSTVPSTTDLYSAANPFPATSASRTVTGKSVIPIAPACRFSPNRSSPKRTKYIRCSGDGQVNCRVPPLRRPPYTVLCESRGHIAAMMRRDDRVPEGNSHAHGFPTVNPLFWRGGTDEVLLWQRLQRGRACDRFCPAWESRRTEHRSHMGTQVLRRRPGAVPVHRLTFTALTIFACLS